MRKLKYISNFILKFQEDIKISEKKKSNENKEANEIIISNKFLIKNKKPKIVEIKKEPEEIDIPSKISNISNEITDIKMDFNSEWGKGIDDWPENYSKNSIIKFLWESIVKIQMLPLLIKDAVKKSNQERIVKCNFILSDLFNI